MSVQRVRREFGAPVTFADRNAGDVKDGYIECAPYEDKAFDLKRMELDKGIQVRKFISRLTYGSCLSPKPDTYKKISCHVKPRFADRKSVNRLSSHLSRCH